MYKTEREYHADKSRLSNSTLGLLNPPARYKWWFENAGPVEPTDAMLFGSLCHCMLFEPGQLNKRYLFTDLKRRGTKAWLEAEEEAGERQLLKITDRYSAAEMVAKIIDSDFGRKVLTDGAAEVVYLSELEGLEFKMKADFTKMFPSGDYLIDYKTTRDASPTGFAKSVTNYSYHRQAALYIDLYEAATGRNAKAMVFLAQEKTEPYLWGAYSIAKGSEEYELGKAEYLEKIELYKHCLSSGEWPTYSSNKIQPLIMPTWAFK